MQNKYHMFRSFIAKPVFCLVLSAGFLTNFYQSAANAQQRFSCPYGTDAVCLDYGDKVCNRFAKCVDENASCFSQFTCDYNGFVCKSTLNEAVQKIDETVDEYNSLVRRFNDMKDNLEEAEYRIAELTKKSESLEAENTRLGACIRSADTLEEAQYCR